MKYTRLDEYRAALEDAGFTEAAREAANLIKTMTPAELTYAMARLRTLAK